MEKRLKIIFVSKKISNNEKQPHKSAQSTKIKHFVLGPQSRHSPKSCHDGHEPSGHTGDLEDVPTWLQDRLPLWQLW